MKKIIFSILILFLIISVTNSQVVYNYKIDSVINLVSTQMMKKFNRELSGDTFTTVGSTPLKIFSRLFNSPGNQLAAQYIYERFQSMGYPVRYQINNSHNINVIAKKTGTLYPNFKFVISGHYDNILSSGAGPLDTIYGADDNATGVTAVLEAARLLKNYDLKYTVEFVAFDEEEIGLLGAYGYADSCHYSSDTLIGVLNLDMVGWDSNNDGLVRIMTPQQNDLLCDILMNCYQRYNLQLSAIRAYNSGGSDHVAFWNHGFMAITSIEPSNDFNPYYHSKGDVFNVINMNYFLKNIKANIAALISLADEQIYYIFHNPIQSGIDTSARIANAYIVYPVPKGTGNNAPRLYYKIGNGSYQYINASQINNEQYTFNIPGQTHGIRIYYYIAAQDSAGQYLITSPSGGSGVNPPGTTPPPNVYSYTIWSGLSYSSNNQKAINDMQFTYDSIHISQSGITENVKVNLNINHTNDGDVVIWLSKSGYCILLTQNNGEGGHNFINTTLNDSALISITQGTPPFTGSFRPQYALSGLRGVSVQGDWVLRIFDNRQGNTGTLLNWTLDIQYSPQVSVKKEEIMIAGGYHLEQNFPNPFNSNTVIKYQIPVLGFVSLKIYNLLGREIKTLINETQNSGKYSVSFNSSELPSGVYFYKLNSNGFTSTKRMVIIK